MAIDPSWIAVPSRTTVELAPGVTLYMDTDAAHLARFDGVAIQIVRDTAQNVRISQDLLESKPDPYDEIQAALRAEIARSEAIKAHHPSRLRRP